MELLQNIAEQLRSTFGLDGRMPRRRFRTLSGPMRVYEVIYDDGELVRVMNVRGTYQSATYLDDECYKLVFGYHRAYNCLFEAGLPINRLLMLGGGGFSYPKYVVSHHPETAVDAVEIDPMVISVAQRWFYLDRLIEEFATEETGRLRIFEDDARAFLEDGGMDEGVGYGAAGGVVASAVQSAESTGGAGSAGGGLVRYDAIVNDCFAARIPVMSLATVEAARAIHARLTPGGLYLTNVISALRGPNAKLLHAVIATLRSEFSHVRVVPGSEGLPRPVDNYVVVASDGDYRFAHEIDVLVDEEVEVLVDRNIESYEFEFYLKDT